MKSLFSSVNLTIPNMYREGVHYFSTLFPFIKIKLSKETNETNETNKDKKINVILMKSLNINELRNFNFG